MCEMRQVEGGSLDNRLETKLQLLTREANFTDQSV